MGFRWLVNAGLLALPIGTTVGILLGVDSHRQATGQEPLFNGDTGGGSGGGNGNSRDHRITEKQYCQKQVGISPPSKGSRYTCKQIWLDVNTKVDTHPRMVQFHYLLILTVVVIVFG